jgi:hypothetical protein
MKFTWWDVFMLVGGAFIGVALLLVGLNATFPH